MTSATRATDEGVAPRYRAPWAELLRKVFAIDVLECPRCAGRLQLVAYIADGGVAKRILDHLGMRSQAPPVARAASAEELPLADPLPDYDVADPTWDDRLRRAGPRRSRLVRGPARRALAPHPRTVQRSETPLRGVEPLIPGSLRELP